MVYVVYSGFMWLSGCMWLIVAKIGEVAKVAKSGEKYIKVGKVGKSKEKWLKL